MATKAQQTYEQIEKLVAAGTTRPAAFKQLAQERNQTIDSVRGAYYTGRRQAGGGSTTTRRRTRTETTPDDAIAAAIASLETSIETIEIEVADAEERAEEAEREHQALRQAAGPKIAEIKTKIDALRGDTTDG